MKQPMLKFYCRDVNSYDSGHDLPSGKLYKVTMAERKPEGECWRKLTDGKKLAKLITSIKAKHTELANAMSDLKLEFIHLFNILNSMVSWGECNDKIIEYLKSLIKESLVSKAIFQSILENPKAKSLCYIMVKSYSNSSSEDKPQWINLFKIIIDYKPRYGVSMSH